MNCAENRLKLLKVLVLEIHCLVNDSPYAIRMVHLGTR